MASVSLFSVAKADNPTPEEQAKIQKILDLKANLHPQYGDVRLILAEATLHLGQDYYFLSAEEAKKVLVDGWGNPPGNVSNVIGMIFKDKTSFINAQWGAVVTFKGTGYVSDEDSKTADYDAIITQMREGEAEENAARVKQGYEPVHIVGWAQHPSYDPQHHSIVWAQDLRFGTQKDDTLNYDVRVLGRRGYVSLNMVSTMSQLPDVDIGAKKLATVAAYNPGARYEDYSPSSDAKAEYGLAGLVAAGVGVAVAKKVGLLALLLAFGKKFFIVGLMIVAGLFGRIKRLFSRRS
ncbi:DUF2167 domain-containing protein [Labrys okinawensis]|uniref:DUF2167 domain-containing protein n=1 Tax=Labrys okinawensis TaxID=346911 RepID=UPI0039BD281C